MVFEIVPNTYTNFPYGSTTNGPGPFVLPGKENGERATGTNAPGTPRFAHGIGWLVTVPLHMVYALTLLVKLSLT